MNECSLEVVPTIGSRDSPAVLWSGFTTGANSANGKSIFLAASRGTPEGYASFISTQLEDPDAAALVADDIGDVISYAYAAVEGYDYMALRGPAGVLHDIIVNPMHRG